MINKKIGFCFLIYDIINHEYIWNIFFNGVDKSKFNIYIHYKYNKNLEYFEEYKLDNCIETKYSDVSIVHAHNLLFKKAFDDGCDKIISLSQSCVPLKSFDYVYNFLTKDDFGHFNVAPQKQCFPRCNNLIKYFDKKNIQKSSNWFILNRKTCQIIINYDKNKINKEFGKIYCPEEHYFIITIFNNNLLDNIIITPNLANGATTFTNWEGMDYKFPSKSELKNYNSISEDELEYLLNSECLFGRKFNKECDLVKNNYISFIKSVLPRI